MEPEVLEHILDRRKKPTKLQLSLLMNITENFSEEREIGKGGFATVYKGVLPNGNVAVKRIMNKHTIDDAPFSREVDILLAVDHPNIVQFLGYCASTDLEANPQEGSKAHIYAEQKERLLCFEYADKGSLQEYITDELRGLEWNARYAIIKGICNGLDYLLKKGIYHMDLKPANVLLDSNMVPKITDFGQSRYDEKSHTISMNRYGSRGYCPPEYALSGKRSPKSDVYSLGTIIIELVTGHRDIPNNNKSSVLRRWRHRWRKTGMESPLSYQQVTKCIDIGLLCQELEPRKRPFIGEIVRDINKMEVTNTQISNENESTVGQISPYSDDDMLGIEPLELHFPFELNKEMSCSLELTNETDSYIAFEVKKTSPLPYCTKPHEGIVPPRSKCGVDITLQPQDKAPQRANGFIVRSTRVNSDSTTEHTKAMFNNCMGTDVDEVNLDVIFESEGSQDYGDKPEKQALSQTGRNASYKAAATYWMENYPLVGRETEMNELRSYTAKARFSDSSQVISVWGIAGIGKTALVRNLYYDRMLGTEQFNMYIWADVSHPFNLRDFSRSLHSDFRSDPIKECREILKEHNCLVVIDDLQSKEEWDLIQSSLVSRPSGSVIIVITSEASIASYCTNNKDLVFNVKGLEADVSKNLFINEVGRNNPLCPLYNHKSAEPEELILKCGGLPKVIVSIAASLATQTVALMDTVISLNDKFIQHLENNPDYDSLRGLFYWMYNYFRTCPDSLKPCIFYLSIFPRGQSIRRRRLVMRWIAEGYARDSEEESAVDKGENFFSQLLDLSIVQQIPQLVTTAFSDTRMAACQVNVFIREYINSRRMEGNLVFELGPNSFLATERAGYHLIILNSWDRDRIMFESIDFSRLQSLSVFGQWESFFISISMGLLEVLDLEDAVGVKDEDLKIIVQQMLRLKFLSLRGCSEISRLPNSLGNLRQLQTLDVRHTSIDTLPASIGKLQKLQYIRAGSKVPASSSWLPEFLGGRGLVGVKVPRAIGNLTALHTLGVINVRDSGGKAIVKELKKLTQLRKLGVSGINRHSINEFFSEISGLVHLESLLVELDEDSQGYLEHISLTWKNLQSLKLYGLKDMLPLRIPLRKLRKLDLEMDTLRKIGMEFLANLPELCSLHLRVKQLVDGKLHFHAEMYGEELETFKKVKILEVTSRSDRLHVMFGSKSMKNLELLKIDCSSASYKLTGLDHLSQLKEFLIKGTNDEEIKTHLENQLANHPKAPSVKLVAGLPRLA